MDINNDIILTNIYASWYNCYQKNKLVENYNSSIIVIDDNITIKKDNSNIVLLQNIKKSNSIIISQCQDCIIIIKNKINHITIEKSHNTKLIILNGLISGIDIISSFDNSIFVKNKSIYYISYGKSRECNLYLSRKICLTTLINTLFCIKINIIITTNDLLKIVKEYLTNTNYFIDLQYFIFREEDNKICLCSFRKNK